MEPNLTSSPVLPPVPESHVTTDIFMQRGGISFSLIAFFFFLINNRPPPQTPRRDAKRLYSGTGLSFHNHEGRCFINQRERERLPLLPAGGVLLPSSGEKRIS